MKTWSLRTKSTLFVVGLTTASVFLASTLHHRFALRALKEEVRTRATYVATELAFGVTTQTELEDGALLAAQIRNTLAARPTLRWIEVYATGPGKCCSSSSAPSSERHRVPLGAGSVVTRDVPDYALVYGSPARVRGWMCQCGELLTFETKDGVETAICKSCGDVYRKQEQVVIPERGEQ